MLQHGSVSSVRAKARRQQRNRAIPSTSRSRRKGNRSLLDPLFPFYHSAPALAKKRVRVRGKEYGRPDTAYFDALRMPNAELDSMFSKFTSLREAQQRVARIEGEREEERLRISMKRHWAAVQVQCCCRMWLSRKRLNELIMQVVQAENAKKEAIIRLQRFFRRKLQSKSMVLLRGLMQHLNAIETIQRAVRRKLARDAANRARARRNSGLLKWDIVKARMRELMSRHDMYMGHLKSQERASRDQRQMSRRKTNASRNASLLAARLKIKRNNSTKRLMLANNRASASALTIEDLTRASPDAVKRSGLRRSSAAYLLQSDNTLQAFLGVNKHRLVFSGNYVINARTVHVTFFIIGDEAPQAVEESGEIQFELLMVLSFYRQAQRLYALRICESEWMPTGFGRWTHMDEGTKEALCKHVADVLCSKDVNIESQVLSKICDEFLITDRELMLFSRHFKALDTDHSGQVDVREFTRYYKLESQLAMAERAFLAFDVDNTRDVDLTEYIGGVLSYLTMDFASLTNFAFGFTNKSDEFMLSRQAIVTACQNMFGTLDLDSSVMEKIASVQFPLTVREFRMKINMLPELLFPAFKMQEKLREQIMGEAFWVDYNLRLRSDEQQRGKEGMRERLFSLMNDDGGAAFGAAAAALGGGVFPAVFTHDGPSPQRASR